MLYSDIGWGNRITGEDEASCCRGKMNLIQEVLLLDQIVRVDAKDQSEGLERLVSTITFVNAPDNLVRIRTLTEAAA